MTKMRWNYFSSCFFGSTKSPFTWVKACPLRSVTRAFPRSQPAHSNTGSSSWWAMQGDLQTQALLVGKASKENVYIMLNIIKSLIWTESWLDWRYHASELGLLWILSYWFGVFSKMERILRLSPSTWKEQFCPWNVFCIVYIKNLVKLKN